MSDFNYQPVYGAEQGRQPRVLIATFGDGYEQRAADGLNADLAQWSLSFRVRSADATIIETFLALKAGVTSFTWTPSGESEVRVICPQWTRARTDQGVQTITAMFRQVRV